MKPMERVRRAGAHALREPLLHFVLAGTLIFAVHGWLGAAPEASSTVRLAAPLVAAVRSEFLGREGRPPTRAEEDALLQEFVQDEVLYREGLRRGLDRADLIVRRRVIQKMEFLLDSFAEPEDPSRADLEAYLSAHTERFRGPPRVSFTQIFFSRRRRGEEPLNAAKDLLARLKSGAASPDPSLGDLFLQGYRFESRSPSQTTRIFGEAFTQALAAAKVGRWTTPLISPLGVHLVWLSRREPARMPALEEVLPAVREAWHTERIKARQGELLETLVGQYNVEIERPSTEVAEVRP